MRKRTLAAIIFSLLLCGCNFGQGNNEVTGTTAAETSPETAVSETSDTSETAEATEVTSDTAVTEAVIEIDDAALEKQRKSLEDLIRITASEGREKIFDIQEGVLVPLDQEGTAGLVAECMGKYWFTDGASVKELRKCDTGMKLDREQLGGHVIAKITTGNERYSYRYEVSDGDIYELSGSGILGEISDMGNGVYAAVCHGYDKGPDIIEHTFKNYWFYFEDGDLKEYTGEKITKADFMQYTGGKAVLDNITAEGGEVTDILYRKNDVVNVNYTVTKDGETYNKFFSYDVSGGDCKEVKNTYDGKENNYGAYLPSVLNPYTDEQLALHEVIKNFAGDKPGCEIANTLFGDLDGDGKNELIAVYGERIEDGLISGGVDGELWFASGNIAYKLGNSLQWLNPIKIVSAGQTIVKVEHAYPWVWGGINSAAYCFLIKNSSAAEIKSPNPSALELDGKHGDLISTQMAMDCGYEESSDYSDGFWSGRTWKPYWFYFINNEISEYYGKEITTEDFLKYEGAEDVLKKVADEGMEVRSILKRGNGIININFGKRIELDHGIGFSEIYDNITARYRNGKIFVTEDNDGLEGIYHPAFVEFKKTGQSDFEKFSSMIYDTAEGDEKSFILERFFGDTNNDGKSELYAYYGTEENSSLWYADEKGAEASGKEYELITLDGDILLRKPRSEEKSDIIDYYIMRDGRTRRLNAYDAKSMTRTSENDFSGYITAADALSDGSEETSKEYWFYYRGGAFNEYGAKEITETELAEYKGARAFLDEISSMGGDVTKIIFRENGIININYDAHLQETTQHYYLTLRLDDKDRAEDITPRNEDGTLNNKGYYLVSLK